MTQKLIDSDCAFREAAFAALVGLARKHSGGPALLGNTAELAAVAYRRSLVGRSFPSFWMEAPLAGEPGFDLHVYYDCGQVLPGERFESGAGFGMQSLFDWFFGTETGGVGVGFAHDLRDGSGSVGAYVNFQGSPLVDAHGFFSSLGATESHARAKRLLARMPHEWHPWYLGLFPDRQDAGVRVGAFVSKERQAAYAADSRTLASDLARVGFTAMDGNMLARLAAMASLSLLLELQLDVTEDGTGDTLGADLTLGLASASAVRTAFTEGGPVADACGLFEGWGMADSRWRRIPDASLSRIVPIAWSGGRTSLLLTSIPAFVKAKWVATRP